MDTDGRLLTVDLTTAGVQDAAGAEAIIKGVGRRRTWYASCRTRKACGVLPRR